MYEVLKKIVNLPIEDIHDIGEQACQHVMNTYRWKNVVDKTIMVYNKVKNESPVKDYFKISKEYKEIFYKKYSLAFPFDICRS